MTALRSFGLAMLAAVMLVAGFHAAIGDVLLFKSDFASLARYFFAASGVLALGLWCLAGVPALLLPSVRPALRRVYVAVLVTGLVGGFAASVLWILTQRFQLGLLLARVVDLGQVHTLKVWLLAVLPPVAVAGVAGALWLSLRTVRREPALADRVERLGLAVAVTGVMAFAASFAPVESGGAPNGGKPGKMVFVVVDRLPAWAIRPINPLAAPSGFDDLAMQARTYTNLLTAFPYTNGFFGAFYAGRLPGEDARGNLVGRLQAAGVATRIITSHRSAIPESSDSQVSEYRGLRSRLLGPRSVIVPRLLGLDYHYSLAAPGTYEGRFLPVLWQAINPDTGGRGALLSGLAEELGYLGRLSNSGFVLVHVNLSDFGSATGQASPQFRSAADPQAIKNIRDNDYRYAAEAEIGALTAYYRSIVESEVVGLAASLKSFLALLRRSPDWSDAVVVLTADHGTIYGKGRFWYGFHPSREVLHVPLMVFGNGASGRDDRLFSTVDLTKSVLDYFSVAGLPLSDNALSVFAKGFRADAGSLTMRSDKHGEWFLHLGQADRAFLYNLHPQATSPRFSTLTYDGYDARPVETTAVARQDALARLRVWAARFGLSSEEMAAARLAAVRP